MMTLQIILQPGEQIILQPGEHLLVGQNRTNIIFSRIRFFFWDKPYLFKYCPDQIIKKCLPEDEHHSVLTFFYEFVCGGHFGPRKAAEKVLQSGLYWPTLFKASYNF